MLSWFENGQFEIHEKTGAPVDQDSPGRMVGFNDELPQMLERAAATADAELWAKAGEKFVFGIDPEKIVFSGVNDPNVWPPSEFCAMQAQTQRAWEGRALGKIEWPVPATDAEVRDHFKRLALGKVDMAEAEAFEPRLMARRRENEAKGR
jgi:hypothetical protein